MFLISEANAADAAVAPNTPSSATSTATQQVPEGAAAGEPSPVLSALPLILIFVVFYFLLIRPQQKRLREHDAMIKKIGRGDKIVTGGGVIGVVQKVEDDVVVVEIAPEVRIRIMRETVSHLYTTPNVANDNKSK